MWRGNVLATRDRSDRCQGVLHAERIEEVRLHEALPRGAVRRGDHLAGRQEHQVRVAERGPEWRPRLQVAHPEQDVVDVESRVVPEQITAEGAQAAAVGQQIAHAQVG